MDVTKRERKLIEIIQTLRIALMVEHDRKLWIEAWKKDPKASQIEPCKCRDCEMTAPMYDVLKEIK